ncbi:hypothetical protein EYF80_046442 [Liparis tanakae]|uniref:Uncharacterized protein n=1 Tax=Liparis tanakae TaxID=230148 RepID=A0A4Z2FRL6_9TELE|nr:hypothetical protein EYF80_046442 [Liparis tanakae]
MQSKFLKVALDASTQGTSPDLIVSCAYQQERGQKDGERERTRKEGRWCSIQSGEEETESGDDTE